VTTDEQVIAQLVEANPVRESGPHTAQEQAEADRVLQRVLRDAPGRRGPRPRAGLGLLAPAISVVVVVIVAAVILRSGGSQPTGSTPSRGMTITLQAEPTPQVPRVTASAIAREITLMRRRLVSLGHGFTVAQSGATDIVVTVPKAHAAERARVVRLVGQSAQLFFYDWEASALTPNGKAVASQLSTQARAAVRISQGGRFGAGALAAGGLPLYRAAKLAATQSPVPLSVTQSRKGPVYYLFGAPGSAACAAAAKDNGTKPMGGQHCLLGGPDSPVSNLYADLPAGVSKAEGELVTVPQGTVVLQAANPSVPDEISPGSPGAEFFVLKDRVALLGNDITNPRAGTDQSGQPDITFGFNGPGQSSFETLTRQVARRGRQLSVGGATFDQHFAVALDNQLLTVPQIDFRQYPDGVSGGGGADIAGGLTAQSAKDLATELRYGALPLAVKILR
jgi:SecD/SecF fusion protein